MTIIIRSVLLHNIVIKHGKLGFVEVPENRKKK